MYTDGGLYIYKESKVELGAITEIGSMHVLFPETDCSLKNIKV